ncbi:MAG: TetR/AcrR family transcriptional regulator [Polyangiales bacterium]
MTAAPQIDARDTVDRLLEAAEIEFAVAGFEAARLEDIAAAVGVRRASLLYHFESKQALYDRVLERAFSDLQNTLLGAIGLPTTSYADRLDELVNRAVDTFHERPSFAQLLLRDGIDNRAERATLAAEHARRYVAPLLSIGEAFFRSGQETGEFRKGLEPRDVLMFFASAVMFHAASCDAQREVFWGESRGRGRGLAAYRSSMRAMVRAMALADSSLTQRPRPAPARRATHDRRPR